MSKAAPSAELSLDERAVLEHLVRVTPAAHNAQDVSEQTGLAVDAAVRSLQELQRRGYVGFGRPTVGKRPDTVEYVPTLMGLGLIRTRA
jgi:hypothetical protein